MEIYHKAITSIFNLNMDLYKSDAKINPQFKQIDSIIIKVMVKCQNFGKFYYTNLEENTRKLWCYVFLCISVNIVNDIVFDVIIDFSLSQKWFN